MLGKLVDRVVLGYSGGLDTSVAVLWLKEKYGLDIVTVTADVGQQEDLDAVRKTALQLGAVRHYTIDAKEEFVTDYIHKAIAANALYQGKYPLSTALARPLIASKLVEIARKEGAVAAAHGCTGKGNDQVRFEVTMKALAPSLKVIAPVREWGLTRDEELAYAEKHGFKFGAKRSIFSVDQNLWGRSIEGGPLEDPAQEPPPEALEWTRPLKETPDEPAKLELTFHEGVPVAVNGDEKDSVDLIVWLNRFAGQHGVGVIDHMEDRLVGIKSREVYECPAAVCLLEAHQELEKSVLTRHQLAFKALVDREWAWLVYSGLWADPLRDALEAFIVFTQTAVEGKVVLKLYKGGVRVIGRSSPNSLYSHRLATYSKASTFDQSSAAGFVELWGLASRLARSTQPGSDEAKNALAMAVEGR